jgi:hypothetical protein
MRSAIVLTAVLLVVILIKTGAVQIYKPKDAYVFIAPFVTKRKNKWETQFKYHN